MIYLTSDEHYHHKNILTYISRPYDSVEAMNEDMIIRHNSIVKPEDVVYHIGDFTLSRTAVTQILPRLNGIHHLIAGNHDACHPVMSKSPEKLSNARQKYFDAGFKTIELEGSIKIGEFDCLMSHFPYYDPNPEFDQRYEKLRPRDEGKVLLHGHVHLCWKTKLSREGSLMINVGVDVNDYRPISVEEIEKLIKKSINKI